MRLMLASCVLIASVGCKTTEVKQCSTKAHDYIVEGITDKFDCSKGAVVSEDVKKWTEINKICNEDLGQQEYTEKLPDGLWTDDGINCYYMIEEITSHRKVVPVSWDCKAEKDESLKDIKPLQDGCSKI